jgi:hypothetical protein
MEILTEKEFRKTMTIIYQQERIKILNEKWDRLSKDDKLIIIEMFKILNPNVRIPINEAKWYNTVMDWAGLIPGIGSAIDLVNGFSYWRQGDKLFAILSWIGALPIFGDLIATPVVSALKLGGKGLVDTVKSWIDVFTKAGKGMNVLSSLGRPAVRKLTRNTKYYMGLLDWLGLSNFVGSPQQLAKKVPDLEKKMAEFDLTSQGKNLSMGGTMGPTEPSTTPSQTTFTPPKAPSTTKTDDPISTLSSLLM